MMISIELLMNVGATVILSGPSGSPNTSVPSQNSKLKLRLTKAQSALLEQAFKHQSTLNLVVHGFRDYIEDFYAAYEQHKLETVAGNECFLEVGDNNEVREHVSVHRSSKPCDRTTKFDARSGDGALEIDLTGRSKGEAWITGQGSLIPIIAFEEKKRRITITTVHFHFLFIYH
ncbi:hypothetical protein Tco_0365412 [Tanacetum coccineum]